MQNDLAVENKLIETNTRKSRMQDEHKPFHSEMPVYDYNDSHRNNQSSMLNGNHLRSNISVNPWISGWNKSQIRSVKVYKLSSTEKDNNLHQNLKTSQKTHKISSKIFKKFLKDYQEKSKSKVSDYIPPSFLISSENKKEKDTSDCTGNPYQNPVKPALKILRRQHFDKNLRNSG